MKRRLPGLLLALLALLALMPGTAAAAPPTIASPAAIVVEPRSGDVAYAKDADTRRPIASTTKLMTALLTLEEGDLSEVVTAPRYRAAPAESLMRPPLVVGEQITRADLLRGLLVVSANDAAVALATNVGGSVPSFVRLMNRRAQQLGLTNTHYSNPVGLDAPDNYSTAHDLATLTRELRKHRFFRRTVDSNTVTLKSGATQRALTNKNTLLASYPWVDGVKTGSTSLAGNVLVASGTRRGVHLISVVMGAGSGATRNAETVGLLNYGFTKYRLKRAVLGGDTIETIPIRHRAGAGLPVVAARTVRKVVPRGKRFTYIKTVPKIVEGPVHFGEKVGKLVVMLDGKPVAAVALTANLEVPKAGFGRRAQDVLTQPWLLIVLAGLLLVAAAISQRRPPSRRPAEEATA